MTTDAPAIQPATPKKEIPWPVQMLHGLVADRIPSRLGTDAMALACILIERQDLIWGKPVGLFMSQLADLCGDSIKNPRRTRAARAALIADGWLICEIPKNGERSEVVYQMTLKTTPAKTVAGKQMTPNQNGLGGSVDPNQNGSGEAFTLTKTVVAPQPKRYGHPNQNGSVTDPSISDPKNSSNSPKATGGSFDYGIREEGIPIPDSLNTPAFREAWNLWKNYKAEEGRTLGKTSQAAQLKKLASYGVDKAITALGRAMVNTWRGFDYVEKKEASHGQQSETRGPAGVVFQKKR